MVPVAICDDSGRPAALGYQYPGHLRREAGGGGGAMVDYCCSPLLHRLGDVIMAIRDGTLKGHKETASFDLSAVTGDSPHRRLWHQIRPGYQWCY